MPTATVTNTQTKPKHGHEDVLAVVVVVEHGAASVMR
jgi:hypothetical protein